MKWARKPYPGGQGAGAAPPGLVSPREVPPLLLAGEVDVGGPIAALMDRDRTWAAAAGGGLGGQGPAEAWPSRLLTGSCLGWASVSSSVKWSMQPAHITKEASGSGDARRPHAGPPATCGGSVCGQVVGASAVSNSIRRRGEPSGIPERAGRMLGGIQAGPQTRPAGNPCPCWAVSRSLLGGVQIPRARPSGGWTVLGRGASPLGGELVSGPSWSLGLTGVQTGSSLREPHAPRQDGGATPGGSLSHGHSQKDAHSGPGSRRALPHTPSPKSTQPETQCPVPTSSGCSSPCCLHGRPRGSGRRGEEPGQAQGLSRPRSHSLQSSLTRARRGRVAR